jgi:hypothetical protein
MVSGSTADRVLGALFDVAVFRSPRKFSFSRGNFTSGCSIFFALLHERRFCSSSELFLGGRGSARRWGRRRCCWGLSKGGQAGERGDEDECGFDQFELPVLSLISITKTGHVEMTNLYAGTVSGAYCCFKMLAKSSIAS